MKSDITIKIHMLGMTTINFAKKYNFNYSLVKNVANGHVVNNKVINKLIEEGIDIKLIEDLFHKNKKNIWVLNNKKIQSTGKRKKDV